VIGAAQLPCEYFVVAVVADDVESTEPARYRARLLLVSDAFVVRGMATVGESEMRDLGRDAIELLTRKRTEVSFRSEGGHLHLWIAPRADGEVAVAGRIVRDEGPAYSAFETRTDRGGLEAFADGLRQFPFATS
jgi:hypothetical protein